MSAAGWPLVGTARRGRNWSPAARFWLHLACSQSFFQVLGLFLYIFLHRLRSPLISDRKMCHFCPF